MPKLIDLNGVGPVLANACVEHGYRSVEDIAAARESELVAVPGVSSIRAKQLIEGAKVLLNGGVPPATTTDTNAKAQRMAQDSSAEGVSVKMKKKNKKKSTKKKADKKNSKKQSKKSDKLKKSKKSDKKKNKSESKKKNSKKTKKQGKKK